MFLFLIRLFLLIGFKKEHLRVMVSNQGLVRFSGERDAGGNTRYRFQREIRVAKDCNMSGIQAKFMRENLHIIMPKNPTATAAQDQAAPPAEESGEHAKLKQEQGKSDEEGRVDESRDPVEGRSGAEGGVSSLKTWVKVAVVAAVVVAFGAFAAQYYQNFINFTKK